MSDFIDMRDSSLIELPLIAVLCAHGHASLEGPPDGLHSQASKIALGAGHGTHLP